MALTVRTLLFLVLLLSGLAGCGDPTPAELLDEADHALRADHDPGRAIAICDRVIHWTGEGGPSKDQLRRARDLEWRGCVADGDFERALKSFSDWNVALPEGIGFMDLVNLVKALADAGAIPQAVQAMKTYGGLFEAERQEKLKKLTEMLKKKARTPEQLKSMSELPYL